MYFTPLFLGLIWRCTQIGCHYWDDGDGGKAIYMVSRGYFFLVFLCKHVVMIDPIPASVDLRSTQVVSYDMTMCHDSCWLKQEN